MKLPGNLRLLDFVAVALAAAFFVASLYWTAAQGAERLFVHVEAAEDEWLYPLDAYLEVEVPGPLGHTHVHIQDGVAYVSESPCTEKICIAMGEIDRAGAWIACLPNRVFVRIEGGEEDSEVDALVF